MLCYMLFLKILKILNIYIYIYIYLCVWCVCYVGINVLTNLYSFQWAPSDEEDGFVNRKNFHSINTQVICDATLRVTDLVARWPGSTHDSFILMNSGTY